MVSEDSNSNWVLYILKCSDQTLYTGITNNLENRLLAHQMGKGAKYTRGRTPLDLIHIENFHGRSDAAKREAAIKKLSRANKLKLIS